jgi:nitrogen fixation protein FixH
MNPRAPVSPPAAPREPVQGRRSPWRDGMLWLIGGIVATTVGVNGVMFWYAEEEPTYLVRQDYYDASKTYDRDHAARLASARLGWRVDTAEDLRSRDTLTLRIADAAGRPVSGLAGTVSAYRPSDARLDQPLRWSEDGSQPGLYRASFARPAQGLWRVTLDVSRGGQRLFEDLTVAMP